MRLPLTVVDNFFETPTLVRNFALQQEFFKGDRGNWPGIRTKFLDELDINFFNTFHEHMFYHFFADFGSILGPIGRPFSPHTAHEDALLM